MVRLSSQTDELLDDFAAQVFSLDRSIRFLCVSDEQAHLMASHAKPHVKRRLVGNEFQRLLRTWTVQIMIFDKYSQLTGPLDYYLMNFGNFIGTGIPLTRGKSVGRLTHQSRIFLFMSFETGIDAAAIIEDKILPLVAAKKDYFF